MLDCRVQDCELTARHHPDRSAPAEEQVGTGFELGLPDPAGRHHRAGDILCGLSRSAIRPGAVFCRAFCWVWRRQIVCTMCRVRGSAGGTRGLMEETVSGLILLEWCSVAFDKPW